MTTLHLRVQGLLVLMKQVFDIFTISLLLSAWTISCGIFSWVKVLEATGMLSIAKEMGTGAQGTVGPNKILQQKLSQKIS